MTGFFASGAPEAQSSPIFRFDVNPGPYAAGLKVVDQYDFSRTYRHPVNDLGKPDSEERARPLQTLVWYPAEHSDTAAMRVRDYVDLWATETSFGQPKTLMRLQEWRSALRATLDMPLRAVRDAPAVVGHFPVVIYAPGASDMAWENADLCEYLASFGYLVIATPSLGVMGRTMSIDLAGANAQARDIGFLLGYARSLSSADLTAVAVVGGSWGGMAALFAAARDSRISALVALDGSTRYFPGLLKLAGDVHPENMSIPLIYFMQGDYSVEVADRLVSPGLREGPSPLNAWSAGDLIIAHMLGLAHASLSSMWQRNQDYWSEYGSGPLQPGDYDREDAITGYAWVVQYVLQFLDAYLKRDARAIAFLGRLPTENGVPRHVMTVSYRTGSHSGQSMDDFRAEIGRQGFDHASEIYAAFQHADGGFNFDENAAGDWAEELISDDHVPEAITLLRVNAQIHPESSSAYERLGGAYRISGQYRSAIRSYRTALQKDPNNATARRKLEELSAPTTQRPRDIVN